ncbi:MAG TPA: endonuclease [Paludibacteraceae bacterium]|nr:endonuclease [Paludibacteraceae bacterium]HRS68288.1 endonuclease [Paludibacteraceae bacterium]
MKTRLLLLFLLCLTVVDIAAQQPTSIRVMCYNVENLFDVKDDSLTNDSEYLPGGIRGWNYQRYEQKLAHIAQVITAVGGWSPPAIIGLCEIENNNCLKTLTRYSHLKSLNYQYVHYESPDARGVDVALLYQPHLFNPITSRPIKVLLNSERTTRDILYVCGTLPNQDTIHLFVNHFPSRLGGELESEPNRIAAAATLRAQVDTVLMHDSTALVLIMGDFNDYPTNRSIKKVLDAQPLQTILDAQQLYNLTYDLHQRGKIGSYKHAGQWGMLDQFIASGSWLNSTAQSFIDVNSVTVFAPEWLLEDAKPLGKQPARTYVGMRFNGGYSDHLPIALDITLTYK